MFYSNSKPTILYLISTLIRNFPNLNIIELFLDVHNKLECLSTGSALFEFSQLFSLHFTSS